MGSSASIQFRGLESVMKAYNDRGDHAWSLWQASQFLTKGMSEEELKAFLQILINSGSAARYTLKVYEDITDPKKIKSNTPDDGSFNFTLMENDGYAGVGGSSVPYRNPMQMQMDALNQKFDRLLNSMEAEEEEEEEEEEEPANDFMGAVIGLLKNPEKLEKFINVVKPLITGGEPQPAYVGNVNRLDQGKTLDRTPATPDNMGDPSLSPSQDEARFKRIYAAIEKLNQYDKNLPEHLEKLALIASANPSNFSSLLSMLELF